MANDSRLAQQARRCGFDPADASVWQWWAQLCPPDREELLRICDPRHVHYTLVADDTRVEHMYYWQRMRFLAGELLLAEMEGEDFAADQDLFRFKDLVRRMEDYPLPMVQERTFHTG